MENWIFEYLIIELIRPQFCLLLRQHEIATEKYSTKHYQFHEISISKQQFSDFFHLSGCWTKATRRRVAVDSNFQFQSSIVAHKYFLTSYNVCWIGC